MEIKDVRVRICRLENQTLSTSYGERVIVRDHLFVSLRDLSGREGIGEGSPLPHFSGERAKEMVSVVEGVFAPLLLGMCPFDLEAIRLKLDQALPHHGASKAAIVTALLDLQGKQSGLPVARLLGGLCKTSLPLAGAIGVDSIDEVVSQADSFIRLGMKTIKIKVGREPGRDVEVIKAVRNAAGPEVEIRADANQGYKMPDALRFLKGAAEERLQYIEQPLAAGDLEGLAVLRRKSPIPIAVDESLFGLADALNIIRRNAADVFIIKLIKLGGVHQARKVAAMAEAAGVPCVAVSPYETSLGVSAIAHLIAGSNSFPWASELCTGPRPPDPAGMAGVEILNGRLLIHDQPGLGVSLPGDFFREAMSVTGKKV